MKRTLLIHLMDGTERTIDLTQYMLKNKLPLNITANDANFAALVMGICSNGFLDEEKTDTNNLVWIGASQIKSCEIKFTKI